MTPAPCALALHSLCERRQNIPLQSCPGLTPATEGEAVSFGCLQEAAVGRGGWTVTRIRWAQAGRGISRRAMGNSRGSGREGQQAGAGSYSWSKDPGGRIPPSTGRILSAGSSVLLWGESPWLCPGSQRGSCLRNGHSASCWFRA